jgi:hypothetical protein
MQWEGNLPTDSVTKLFLTDYCNIYYELLAAVTSIFFVRLLIAANNISLCDFTFMPYAFLVHNYYASIYV